MSDIGTRIKQRRHALGITQKELAARANVSLSTIKAAEVDPARKPKELNRIAMALAMDPIELEFGPAKSRYAWKSQAPSHSKRDMYVLELAAILEGLPDGSAEEVLRAARAMALGIKIRAL